MITKELLNRINELARKKRTIGLTEDETLEQKKLYDIYLADIRGQVTNLLENIEVVDPPKADPPKKNKKILTQKTINLRRMIH